MALSRVAHGAGEGGIGLSDQPPGWGRALPPPGGC